ncbi:MAG: serine acetyltransferase [Gemmatimonadota bacterium]
MIFLEDLRCKAEWCYGDRGPKSMLKALLTDGTFAMACYRAMAWSHRRHLTPVAMLCNKVNAVLGQCIIGRGAEFGPGFVLVHSQGVVINGRVRGGANVYIEHQVTIGAEKLRSPVLGDRVFVGAGAKILGAITIGSDVRIGANAVVVKDVPSRVTVGGVPARILKTHDGEVSSEASPRE